MRPVGLLLPAWLVAAQASELVRAHRGMVASESALATQVGVQVLQEGGTAVDAAVATAFALAVTCPAAGNLGGGGFLLHRAASGKAVAYDFREVAPAAADAWMFVTNGAYDVTRHHHSHRAVGVPGTVAGLHLAWRDHGRLPWRRLVEPAIKLAATGFPVSEELARSLTDALPKLRRSTAAYQQFTRSGIPYAPGEILQQPDLAATLERIARRGPAGFYRGEVAQRLAREMTAGDGLITQADLREYRALRREPVRGTYREFEVLSMPPPSSGGTVLVLMLNLLEELDLARNGRDSAATIHLVAEAMRLGFAERARWLGDPDFNPDLPLERLLSKEHAARLRATIQPDRASPSSLAAVAGEAESRQTTHLSVVDAARNAVALTYTLEESYGSGLMAPGTGFLLNNEMGDFNPAPGLTTTNGLIGTAPNLAAPRKRMLSSMTPTILVKDHQPVLVLGSPGGRTIINTVLLTILNVVDFGLDLETALATPRFHHQWFPDRILCERGAFSTETIAALRALGHRLEEYPYPQGAVGAIRVDPGTGRLEGLFDPRAPDGAAAGW
ncbi:MAG: gamma-glutamyltransferase [Verrucomicrobiales bacterium]|nr:gamma-glutamyltransferase [Verrucomicrobiales bacterium]